MTQDNSKLTTICTKTTDCLNRLIYWLKAIWHLLKGLRIASNSVPIADEEPVFQIPNTATTREAVEAYVDQYVKDSIAWQEREFQKWKLENITLPLHDPSKVKQRRRQVWKWSAISFGLLLILMLLGYIPTPPVFADQEPNGSPSFYAMLGLLITAPIAYAIWTIRDENAAQTLENARKDTNLKDFQRLSEWASGFHLPEDKIVSLSKTISKETETTTETSTTTETYSPPKDVQQVSRRMGAESLQVAAIYQLQVFMRGAYGEQFMKPAFHMLHSIWEGLMHPLLPPDTQVLDDNQIMDVKNRIEEHHQKPIYRAVNNALVGDGGMTLRVFRDELAGLFLAGVSTNGENMHPLRLAGLNLRGTNVSWSSLKNSKLQGIKLVNANMTGANVQGSLLFKSNLFFAKAQYVDMYTVHAKLINLSYAKLMYANLFGADFELATLDRSDLQNANLGQSKLRYTSLMGANVPKMDYYLNAENTKICDKTTYQDCKPKSTEAEHQKLEWLRMGATFVDSETGEPINPS